MNTRIPLWALAAALVWILSGCATSRGKRGVPPPPPPPAVAVTPKPRPAEAAMPEPGLPQPAVEVPQADPALAPPAPRTAEEEEPIPVPAQKPSRRHARTPRPGAANSKQAPEPAVEPAAPPTSPPRLGEVLTANQRKQMAAQLDRNVAAARRILSGLAGRPLSLERNEAAGRVRAFIEQALGMKETDLGTGVELSRRALVLAQDLAGRRP